MLKFIIKHNDVQIGQIQFDKNWSYDDAIKILGIYVRREIEPQSPVDSEIIAKDSSIKDAEKPIPLALKFTDSVIVQASSIPESLKGAHTILDRNAIGMKRVVRYKEQMLTGNMVAVLSAIGRAGEISEARDLQDDILSDARFKSPKGSEVGTLRYIIRLLIERGLGCTCIG